VELNTDVFVVGGGPAGLAAAIASRARGFRVLVADALQPPIAKACGEGLLPDAVAALSKLGVVFQEEDGRPLRGIRFEDGGTSVSANFPYQAGRGIRRERLHEKLIEQAADVGVSFLWNTTVTGLDRDGVLVAGGNKIRVQWVIGADGSHSRVRSWSGMQPRAPEQVRFAFRQHFKLKPWNDFIEIHWARTGQAYVTPVGPQEICVVLILDSPGKRFEESIRDFPALHGRLTCAQIVGTERGAVTSMFRLNRVYRGNVALIGDASGSVDAITGEGLSLSFQQAPALADALAAGDLERYQRAHRRMALRPRFMAELLLLLDRRSGLRKQAMRALEGAPHLFERMIAFHIGIVQPLKLAKAGAVMGWRLLTA